MKSAYAARAAEGVGPYDRDALHPSFPSGGEGSGQLRCGFAGMRSRPGSIRRDVEDAVPYDRDALHPVGRDAHIAPGHGTDPENGRRGRRPLRGRGADSPGMGIDGMIVLPGAS